MTQAPDLLSAVIEFQPRRTVALRRETTGQLVHGAFLDLIKEVDVGLSNQLHAGDDRKPFTVSAVFGVADGEQRLESERTYSFRVTALSAELVTCLAPVRASELHLLGQKMPLVAVRLEHAWSRNLLQRHVNHARPPQRIGFRFTSPTLVECDDRACGLFPEPNLVFQGIAEKWLAFGSVPDGQLGSEMRKTLGEVCTTAQRTLLVSCYDIHTAPVYFRGDDDQGTAGYLKIGYVGSVEYVAAKDARPDVLRVFNLLAEYASFAGVGYGTPAGMGQVQPFWPKPARLAHA